MKKNRKKTLKWYEQISRQERDLKIKSTAHVKDNIWRVGFYKIEKWNRTSKRIEMTKGNLFNFVKWGENHDTHCRSNWRNWRGKIIHWKLICFCFNIALNNDISTQYCKWKTANLVGVFVFFFLCLCYSMLLNTRHMERRILVTSCHFVWFICL